MKHTIDDIKTVNPEFRLLHNRIGLFNSHFQNFKQFGIPKAQLILTDIPYNIGKNAYGSNPSWYIGGDNKNGESDLAGEEFFDTDDVIIDPCAGSGSTLIAAAGMGRKAYGFEIKKGFYSDACEAIKSNIQLDLFNESEQMKRRQQYEQQLQLT